MAVTQTALEEEAPSSNGWFQLAVPSDGSRVEIKKIVPHTGKGKPVQCADITKKLKSLKVVHGINIEAINMLLEDVQANILPEGPVEIARSDVEEGREGSLEWCIEALDKTDADALVASDEQLAVLTPADPGSPGKNVYGKQKTPRPVFAPSLQAGKGIRVEENDDGQKHYYSTYPGEVIIESDTIRIDPHLRVSADGMEAHMDILLCSGQRSEPRISEADILTLLAEHDVREGIIKQNIFQALKSASSGFAEKVLVARGKPAQDGVDARLVVDEKLAVGKLLANGEIDFHEKSYPWNVKKGDTIGTLIPPVPAEDGFTISGEVLPGVEAKSAQLNLEGIEHKASGELVASKHGVLLVNGLTISVSERLDIKGSVCHLTGNIHSEQTVIVKGYVEAGYAIDSGGDVVVEDNIEQASVRARGSIIVKSGIRGSESRIISRGNITASFMENATLKALGDITVENSMVSCHTYCNGILHIGNQSTKGTLIGGDTHAVGGVVAANLGSEGCKITDVRVGRSIDYLQQARYHEEERIRLEREIDELKNVFAQRRQNPSPENIVLLKKIKHSFELRKSELAHIEESLERIRTLISESRKATILIKEHVYPGVRINIFDKSHEVTQKQNAGLFFLQEDLIIFRPAA